MTTAMGFWHLCLIRRLVISARYKYDMTTHYVNSNEAPPVLNQQYFELLLLLKTLLDDSISLLKLTIDMGEQVLRRSYIRSSLAGVEGAVWVLKQMASISKEAEPPYTGEEQALLCDIAYILKDNGIIKEDAAKISLKTNIKFTFRMLSRLRSCGFELDLGGNGWPKLQAAIKLRDRITHPKTLDNLDISENELVESSEGIRWFFDNIMRFIDYRKKAAGSDSLAENEVT